MSPVRVPATPVMLILPVMLVMLACLVSLVGCSGGDADTTAGGGKTGKSAAATPGIDPNSGLDLDGNRVRAFSPAGWRRAPTSYDYLVRYQSTPQLPFPSVVIVAADPPEGFAEVTKANQADFVAAVAARLAGESGGEGQPGLLRPPTAVRVGPHHAAGWSAPGEAKLDGLPKKIERECTAVVVDGRLYTIEAWAPRGKLDEKARAAARAVTAALAVPSLDPVESLVPVEPAPAAEPSTPVPTPDVPADAQAQPAAEPPAEPAAAE